MAFKAKHKFARISPRKARLLMDLIRGRNVDDAITLLRFNKKRASGMVEKVVRSAVANATEQDVAPKRNALYVSAAYPNFGYWTMSGEAIFVIMLGGLNTFLGPVLGAVILSLLNHFVTAHTKYYGLVLGLIILFYAMVLRKGLLDIVLERLRGVRRGAAERA